MTQLTGTRDVGMLTCWWCDEPVDPSSEDHVLVELKKVTYHRKDDTTEKTEFIVPRCASCRSIQGKETILQGLIGAGVLIGGSLGCYVGYLIQGSTGWISWVIAGTAVILSVVLGIWRSTRLSARYPKATGKSSTDYPPVKALVEQGWRT